jgi:hypothetical protein
LLKNIPLELQFFGNGLDDQTASFEGFKFGCAVQPIKDLFFLFCRNFSSLAAALKETADTT